MLVLTNVRLGPAAELLLSPEVASAMLGATADAARARACGRWEHELAIWLDARARSGAGFDVGEIAWTPEHFEHQRAFVVDAIEHAAARCPHVRALHLWARMIAAHPKAEVVVGRRWRWDRASTDSVTG